MKVLFISIVMALSLVSFSQKTTKTTDGNYAQLKKEKDKGYKPEGAIYTDKDGVKYPVYRSTGGKLFILRKSKNTGKEYRYYLKF